MKVQSYTTAEKIAFDYHFLVKNKRFSQQHGLCIKSILPKLIAGYNTLVVELNDEQGVSMELPWDKFVRNYNIFFNFEKYGVTI